MTIPPGTLAARDRAVLWHPYTQARTSPAPLEVVGGDGAYLQIADGRRIFDAISSWWVNIHGHAHPRLNAALTAQASTLEHVMFAGCTHEPAVELAERLVAAAPAGLSRVFYSDNGSTAVEVAIKMAHQYWRNRGELHRRTVVALEHAYHGDTVGAMSVSEPSVFTAAFTDLMFPIVRAAAPYAYRCTRCAETGRCTLACASSLESILRERGAEVSAVLVEPMLQGAGGMIVWPVDFLKEVRRLCDAHGVLLIADEVLTGFGRTGRMFACEHAGVSPDLMCLSKGLTAGYLPMGVTLASKAVYESFLSEDRARTFFHGHSFTANPLACAVALASLDIFRDEPVLDRVAAIGDRLRAGLDALRDVPCVGETRHIGGVGIIELVSDRSTRAAGGYLDGIGPRLAASFLERGLLLRPLGNILYVMPPYVTTPAEVDSVMAEVRDVLGQVGRASQRRGSSPPARRSRPGSPSSDEGAGGRTEEGRSWPCHMVFTGPPAGKCRYLPMMRNTLPHWFLTLIVSAVLAGPAASQTPPTPSGPPPLGTPAPTGVCTISGTVLTPADFGIAAGATLADVSTTILADGRIRLYAFGQGRGVVSAVSVSPDGLSFVPEAGSRLRDGSGMPRILGDPVGGYRLFFTSGDGIKSALSADGLTFAEEAGFRVTKEQAGFTDATGTLQALSGPAVVAVSTGGYRMYFSDLPFPGQTPGGHRVKSAVSADMVNWTVEEGLRMGTGAATLSDSAEHPFALAHPDGQVTLYWGKFGPSATGAAEGLYQSTSADGLTFTTETLSVFSGNDPDLIRRADGTLLAYYGGFDSVIGGTVNVATCPDPAAPAAATSPSGTTNTSPASGVSNTATITITSAGASPRAVTISAGGTVTFVNNDSRAHDMSSDPHPQHTECLSINQAGFVAPGQSRTTGALTTARTCGFHDHDQPGNRNLQGTITIQ